MKVAIIGAGAAGIFAAITQKANNPASDVHVYEKTGSLLSKVKISGGGRCNVTHACFSPSQLIKNYPRGGKFLKKAFLQFSTKDIIEWFEVRDVEIKKEDDGRMFPVSDNSQTIIDCLLKEAQSLAVQIHVSHAIYNIGIQKRKLELTFKSGKKELFDKVIIACGGFNKKFKYAWIEKLGHTIIDPVPSLFTFNMPDEKIKDLAGVVAPQVSIHIQSSGIKTQGPLLITHWGMSGPAVLKLSAFAARFLNEKKYEYRVQINWLNKVNVNELQLIMFDARQSNGRKKIKNHNPTYLPKRLWEFLIIKAGLAEDIEWDQLAGKQQNRFIHTLLNDEYTADGKTTFKEEFVTAGGVSLSEIDVYTMQSKIVPNLFFAGEVLDIDGVTGGFNFQAAWTTAYIAGL